MVFRFYGVLYGGFSVEGEWEEVFDERRRGCKGNGVDEVGIVIGIVSFEMKFLDFEDVMVGR